MPRKELGAKQVHHVVSRISTKHTAICGSEDSSTRHGDFAFNSPQWIHLSLVIQWIHLFIKLPSHSETHANLTHLQTFVVGGVTSSAFSPPCCYLRFLALTYEEDISGNISRIDK